MPRYLTWPTPDILSVSILAVRHKDDDGLTARPCFALQQRKRLLKALPADTTQTHSHAKMDSRPYPQLGLPVQTDAHRHLASTHIPHGYHSHESGRERERERESK